MKIQKILLVLATAGALLLPTVLLRASDFPSHWVDVPHSSGLHANSGAATNLAWSATLEASGATWVRVEFGDCHLGDRSYVLLISEANQTSHRLNTVSIKQWSNLSGALKGGRVRVELFVAPGDSDVSINITRILVGERPSGFFPATLCDADSRVNTRDDRVGRMFGGGCTAWLVSNGAVCSAGHCVSGGPGSFFEVNVPASDADGSVNPAAPNDQFPIDSSNVLWQDSGGSGGDWGIYALFANNNTGERAHAGRGFIRPTRVVPAVGTSLRITGYGNDNTPVGTTGGFNNDHRTEQTSTGPYAGEFDNGGGNIFHAYRTDTEPANSGSPMIWRTGGVDFSIGIHTDGGCASGGAGSNSGTSFNQSALANALNAYPAGGGERYLDTASATGTQNGTIFEPFRNFGAAYSSAPNGGQVLMVAGSYGKATAGNTGTFGTAGKSITLRAPVGSVVIGN